MAANISTPKGTRDFSEEVMMRRNYIFDIIKHTYQLYGYQAIETPAMENLSTLMGKYGEEGDKLLFKILNSGDFAKKTSDEDLLARNSNALASKFCDRGLRYDLTVPFARYVVQHRNEINFPFKRYQIQTVWRADRPQKGRYREFYQCDADVIGSNSLLNEVELLQIIDTVFNKLDLKVSIHLNNRKLLSGIAEYIGEADKIIDITTAIDKLDKIGIENVNKELSERGLGDAAIEKLQAIFNLEGSNSEKLKSLSELISSTEIGAKGIEEMQTILSYLENLGLKNNIELDLTLARGLNYYTGTIIEVKSLEGNIGSICGGGRYDDLTGIFGLKDMSGVGISFGADRIYDVLNELDKFPKENLSSTKVLFINFGDKEEAYCLPLLAKLRENDIASEIYPSSAKMKKQMTYANNKNIAFVILAGENEIENNSVTIKNMKTGEQEVIKIDELLNYNF